VTAFVLAAARASVSGGSIGRTDSSAMGSVRAGRGWWVRRDAWAETRFYLSTAQTRIRLPSRSVITKVRPSTSSWSSRRR